MSENHWNRELRADVGAIWMVSREKYVVARYINDVIVE